MRIPLWLLLLSEFQLELDSDKEDRRQACYQQDSSSDTQITTNELPFCVQGALLKKAHKHRLKALLTSGWKDLLAVLSQS